MEVSYSLRKSSVSGARSEFVVSLIVAVDPIKSGRGFSRSATRAAASFASVGKPS